MINSNDEMKKLKAEWENKIEREKSRSVKFTTVSGEPIEILYTPDDIEKIDFDSDIGFPGNFPYTRGIHDTMYRGKLWTMRQFAGFGTPEDSNKRYHYLLENGQTGLSVAFDLPTLMGRDADDPLSEGEVGVCGVAVSSLADMEILFKGIPLDKVSTSMTINAPAAMLLAFYIAVAEKQGIKPNQLSGTIQNDILKEYIAQKGMDLSASSFDANHYRHVRIQRKRNAEVESDFDKRLPHSRSRLNRNAQELAFTLADGFAYVEAGIAAGLDIDDFVPKLSFFFNSHLDFFEEIANFEPRGEFGQGTYATNMARKTREAGS